MLIPLLLTLLVLLLLAFLAMLPGRGRRRELQVLRINYAHRGLHDETKPENSRAAFDAAMRDGYGIEMDVRLTADHVPVVFHDATTDRVCGYAGKVAELTVAELQAIPLPDGSSIPTMAEFLRQVGGRVPLLIEIKGEDFDCDVCAKLAELLDDYDGFFSVQSFNPIYLNWFRQNRPGFFRGLLYTNLFKEKANQSALNKVMLTAMLLNFLARPDFIAYNRAYPNELPLRFCRDLFSTPCLAWTVRSQDEAERVRPDIPLIFEGFLPH